MNKKSVLIAGQKPRRRTDISGENSGISVMFAADNLSVARELGAEIYGGYTQKESRHMDSLRRGTGVR